MSKREIFSVNGAGKYEMCEVVLDAHIEEGYLLVKRDNGQELVAVPAYGIWTAITPYDSLYKIKWLREENKRLRKENAELQAQIKLKEKEDTI